MSQEFMVTIEICSNCKQHQWCTRHNQATYSGSANQIAKSVKDGNPNIQIEVIQLGGQKMGSFEISCNGTLLFSKLALGYFPHTTAVTSRILQYIDDCKKGNDLTKYLQRSASPVKPHTGFNKRNSSKSPSRITRNKQSEYNHSNKFQQSPIKEDKKQELNKQAQQKNENDIKFVLQETDEDKSAPLVNVSIRQSKQEKKQTSHEQQVIQQKQKIQQDKSNEKAQDFEPVEQQQNQEIIEIKKQIEVQKVDDAQQEEKKSAQNQGTKQPEEEVKNTKEIQQENKQDTKQIQQEKKEQNKEQNNKYEEDFENAQKVKNSATNEQQNKQQTEQNKNQTKQQINNESKQHQNDNNE